MLTRAALKGCISLALLIVCGLLGLSLNFFVDDVDDKNEQSVEATVNLISQATFAVIILVFAMLADFFSQSFHVRLDTIR